MGKLTKSGALKVSKMTTREAMRKVRGIDYRLVGPMGKTKSGKVIRKPRAYVWGGIRRAVAKK